jgi:hypothetical protein
MRLGAISLFLWSWMAWSGPIESSFLAGTYSPIKGNCDEASLSYQKEGDDLLLIFDVQDSIKLTGPLREQEKVPDGCVYDYSYQRGTKLLEKVSSRSKCPALSENGEFKFRLEKTESGTLVSIKKTTNSKGEVKEERCEFKKR